MLDRWQKANAMLPRADREDIQNESLHLNPLHKVTSVSQVCPEFTQPSYERIRQDESYFKMNNYIKTNKTLAYDRSFGIQKMFYLHT
jgi:hypothetical protein